MTTFRRYHDHIRGMVRLPWDCLRGGKGRPGARIRLHRQALALNAGAEWQVAA